MNRIVTPLTLFTALSIASCSKEQSSQAKDSSRKDQQLQLTSEETAESHKALRHELLNSLSSDMARHLGTKKGKTLEKQIDTIVLDKLKEYMSHNEALLQKEITILKKNLRKILQPSLEQLVKEVLKTDTLTEEQQKLSKGITERLLNNQSFLSDAMAVLGVGYSEAPFLSEKFLLDKKFLYSLSIDSSSLYASYALRKTKISTLITKLKVENNRLVVYISNEARDSGANDDEILTSYPILKTSRVNGENYYQIDFSKPRNSQFLLPSFLEAFGLTADNLQLNIEAKEILSNLEHTGKSYNKELGTPFYFEGADKNLVIRNKVSLKSNQLFYGYSNDIDLRKNILQPTVTLFQGFQVIEEGSFTGQSKDITTVTRELKEKLKATDKSLPYFTTKIISETTPSGGIKKSQKTLKFNTDKEIAFLLTKNVPKKLIPAFKSTVGEFQKAFSLMGDPSNPVVIKAYTEDEFRKRFSGTYDFPRGDIQASDPRFNVIGWDETPGMGTAWASFLANPKTGELQSGLVMFPGLEWANLGCQSYLVSQFFTENPEATALSYELIQEVTETCAQAFHELGITQVALEELVIASGKEAKGDKNGLNTQSQSLKKALARVNRSYAKRMKVDLDFSSGHKQQHQHHKNFVRSSVPCVLSAKSAQDRFSYSKTGYYMIDINNLNSPKEAIIAMLRAVLKHELGHVFSLRHNFQSSVLGGKVEYKVSEDSYRGLTHGSSVMDYISNERRVENGVMKDYFNAAATDPTGGLGVYDYLALAHNYDLDDEKVFEIKEKLPFCTDEETNDFSNCQAFDWGHDYIQATLLRLNKYVAVSLRNQFLNVPKDDRTHAFPLYNTDWVAAEIQKLWMIALGAGIEYSPVKQDGGEMALYLAQLTKTENGVTRALNSQEKDKAAKEILDLVMYGKLPPADSDITLLPQLKAYQEKYHQRLFGVADLLHLDTYWLTYETLSPSPFVKKDLESLSKLTLNEAVKAHIKISKTNKKIRNESHRKYNLFNDHKLNSKEKYPLIEPITTKVLDSLINKKGQTALIQVSLRDYEHDSIKAPLLQIQYNSRPISHPFYGAAVVANKNEEEFKLGLNALSLIRQYSGDHAQNITASLQNEISVLDCMLAIQENSENYGADICEQITYGINDLGEKSEYIQDNGLKTFMNTNLPRYQLLSLKKWYTDASQTYLSKE